MVFEFFSIALFVWEKARPFYKMNDFIFLETLTITITMSNIFMCNGHIQEV